jgi:hypothetical protein
MKEVKKRKNREGKPVELEKIHRDRGRDERRKEDSSRRRGSRKESPVGEERLVVSKKYETKTKSRWWTVEKERQIEFVHHSQPQVESIYSMPHRKRRKKVDDLDTKNEVERG